MQHDVWEAKRRGVLFDVGHGAGESGRDRIFNPIAQPASTVMVIAGHELGAAS